MQNLSLQMTQTTTLKSLADAAKKGDTSADKPASAEPNTSFQTMLSKQVQENQIEAKQASAKQIQAKQAAAKQAVNKPDNASNSQPDTVDTSEQIEHDPKSKTLRTAKKNVDTKPEEVAATDTNAIALATLMPVLAPEPVMNVIPPASTPATSAPALTNADSQLASTLEAATPKQQSLDTVLSNALSQGKSANVPDMDAKAVQDGTIALPDGTMASEHERWLDAMLPNVSKQAAGDESAGAKLMFNAVKDSASKEMVMPASYQPAAQINTALSMQQAASTNVINAYPGKSGWDQAISQKVVWMVGVGEQSATLTLNPPDLGPLQVVIHVHNDQADTTFLSDNAEVRRALEDGMSNLRDKMSEAGIQLGQANVGTGAQSQQQFQQATQSQPGSQLNNNTPALQEGKAGSTNTLVRVANGLVDTFA